jgi:Carboxypeptidase regulatory-like domain
MLKKFGAACLIALGAAATLPPASVGQGGEAYAGAMVGGMLYRESAAGRVPAAGVAVELVGFQSGPAATVQTDTAGFYRFRDVAAGEYYLRVRATESVTLQSNLLSFPDSGTYRLEDIRLP